MKDSRRHEWIAARACLDVRCFATYANYLGHLRTACYAIGCDAPPTSHPAIKRAMTAIAKRDMFAAREKKFIDKCKLRLRLSFACHCRFTVRKMVANLVFRANRDKSDDAPEAMGFAMLWLVSYVFLLRVPSEGLPMRKMRPSDEGAAEEQSIVWREGEDVCLRLRTRKNRRQGSGVLRRKCTCAGGKMTCIVHAFWDGWMSFLPEGEAPWNGYSPHFVIGRLRADLAKLAPTVTEPEKYGTHDFRRGHAEDLRVSGSTLAEILHAGQWKSAAFLRYVNEVSGQPMQQRPPCASEFLQAELEKEVAYHAAVESEDEEWID